MFDRHQGSERAVLVQMALGRADVTDDLDELRRLADTAGASAVGVVTGRRQKPDPATFAGKGKLHEIGEHKRSGDADLIIFNHALSGAQERNLEKELECRVIDRITLILDIFAQRARSAEGKLQVELAQLEHMSTRLVRGWSHLDRQRGGGVGMRGPGETQLETDRQLLGKRVAHLKERIKKVQQQRRTQRRARARSGMINIALVGYTNAGKSTLFNRLTAARTYAADQLFATLDTTLRKLFVPAAQPMVLSDTVGFVRDLPHELVAAFRATLTEAIEADLIVHVVDASSAARDAQIAAVNEVLTEIGANEIAQLLVMNKIDALETHCARIERNESGSIERVWLSARSGDGIELLRNALAERFPAPNFSYEALETAANQPT
jgi:GTP-binding protein HflX